MNRRDVIRFVGTGAIVGLTGCSMVSDTGDDTSSSTTAVTLSNDRTSPYDLGVANWTMEKLEFDIQIDDQGERIIKRTISVDSENTAYLSNAIPQNPTDMSCLITANSSYGRTSQKISVNYSFEGATIRAGDGSVEVIEYTGAE
ncbi:hypothetical protein J2754_000478 [Halarchaeum solikamskense]|uniref:hypothetical protein n=1 Tax=Halarchaeum nitratireducens TaxID=489913 RepID=UPI001B3AAA10|nr:hypothetical protein [Halarchaeum solikamskense]MBP2250181.1 hypothetical protein [Halarchaeum solikamskense]